MERRQFLAAGLRWGAGVGLLGCVLIAANRRGAAAGEVALRPPGAVGDFLSACLRCGLCVRDCPYGALALSSGDSEAAVGTPYFIARRVACEMCETLPCVTVCPSGALVLVDVRQARMGVAVLADHENCLNWQGLRCDVCYRVCPLIDQAITLDEVHNSRTGKHARFLPTVHPGVCTGCGKCEQACVLERSAIKVLPEHLARGAMGAHYRLGWEEKAKNADQPLVPGLIELPPRGPDAAAPSLPQKTPGGGYKGFQP